MKLFRFLSLVLNNFLIKRWSTPKALKKSTLPLSIAAYSRSVFISYILREISLSASSQRCLQLPGDCNDKRAPFTYRSSIHLSEQLAGRENSPEDLLDRFGNLFPILTVLLPVPGNKIHADDTRAQGNPDSDRLRLKGSLASSFAMYRSPLTVAVTAITSPLFDLATLDSVTQFSLRLLFFIFLSLTHSLFSFSSSCTLNEEGYKGDVPTN